MVERCALTLVAGFENDPSWLTSCETFAHDTLGAARIKVRDASVLPLWQQLTDTEELPGTRLTFTTAANTPDAVAFLCGRPIAERMVFHAACGRLHLWPATDEAAALANELEGRGFALLESRGAGVPPRKVQPAVAGIRNALRQALDPAGVFALGA